MSQGWKILGVAVMVWSGSCSGASLAQVTPTVARVEPPVKATRTAHKVELPAAVKAVFESAYPKATIKHVSTEKHSGALCYEVESMDGTQSRDLIYRADGSVIEMEEAIAATDLPPPVQQAITSIYPKGKVLTTERLTRGAILLYEVSVSDAGKRHEVQFDPNGGRVKPAKKAPARSPTKPAPEMQK